jgi:hypothetical protein
VDPPIDVVVEFAAIELSRTAPTPHWVMAVGGLAIRRRRTSVSVAMPIATAPKTVAAPMPAEPQSKPHEGPSFAWLWAVIGVFVGAIADAAYS